MNLRELEPREKKMLAVGAIALAVFIGVWSLAGEDKKGRGTNLKRVRHDYNQFVTDLNEYQQIRTTVDKIDKKLKRTPSDFDHNSLYETLNGIVEPLGLPINKMIPHEAGGTDFYTEYYVDMDMKQISLDDLVELLKKIDSSPSFLRVSQLSVKRRFNEEAKLDVSIRVAAYASKLESE